MIRLMMDHSPPNSLRNFEDLREVEAFVVGGLEGVFAIYIIDGEPDIYYFASGDDGNWWRISNGLHGNWLNKIYLAFAECMIDRFEQ